MSVWALLNDSVYEQEAEWGDYKHRQYFQTDDRWIGNQPTSIGSTILLPLDREETEERLGTLAMTVCRYEINMVE